MAANKIHVYEGTSVVATPMSKRDIAAMGVDLPEIPFHVIVDNSREFKVKAGVYVNYDIPQKLWAGYWIYKAWCDNIKNPFPKGCVWFTKHGDTYKVCSARINTCRVCLDVALKKNHDGSGACAAARGLLDAKMSGHVQVYDGEVLRQIRMAKIPILQVPIEYSNFVQSNIIDAVRIYESDASMQELMTLSEFLKMIQ